MFEDSLPQHSKMPGYWYELRRGLSSWSCWACPPDLWITIVFLTLLRDIKAPSRQQADACRVLNLSRLYGTRLSKMIPGETLTLSFVLHKHQRRRVPISIHQTLKMHTRMTLMKLMLLYLLLVWREAHACTVLITAPVSEPRSHQVDTKGGVGYAVGDTLSQTWVLLKMDFPGLKELTVISH